LEKRIMTKRRFSIPVLIAIVVVVSLGAAATKALVADRDNVLARLQTFSSVLSMVRDYYVEDVDSEELIEAAIRGLLLELDPHSAYLDQERFSDITERHQGEYHGIGIHFDIIDGWLTVISPIEGGPSYDLGLRPGDRLVAIDGVSARNITTQEVFDKLRGPKGTKVNVSVRREGLEEAMEFEIVRDKIPIYSVPYSFMVAPGVGYVRMIRFSASTSDELEEALTELEAQGMEQLVLDLRDNSGGYLNQAVEVTDKFIAGKKLLVYTKGRIPNSSQEYFSTEDATHPRIPLVVMISHGSASASEIVSGAIQDWDRGLVAGETSFGKGLVQRPFKMRDGSGLLLTVARYYTPSGRLIQRDYDSDRREYYVEGYRGTADDDTTRPVFYTSMGRTVYGGGGITPDSDLEYKRLTPFQQRLARDRIPFEFATNYIAQEGLKQDTWGTFEGFLDGFEVTDEALEQCVSFMNEKEFEFTDEDLEADGDYLKLAIKGELAGHIWSTDERYQVYISADAAVQQVIQLLPEAEMLASEVPPEDAFDKTGTEN
jgi:carboxyl-terminal processing protease